MRLQEGRPSDCAGRLPKEVRVYDLLDWLGISYLQADHEPAMTMEACAAVDTAMGTSMCKNLFLCNRQHTDFYLLMLPGDNPLKPKSFPSRLVLPGCPLLTAATWSNIWILLLAL